jgi:hypothetical protein
MRKRFADQCLSIFEREERLAFLGVTDRSYHDFVEQPSGCFDDLHVAVVDGVE